MSVETMKLAAALPPFDELKTSKPKTQVVGYTQAALDDGHIYAKEDSPKN